MALGASKLWVNEQNSWQNLGVVSVNDILKERQPRLKCADK